MLPRPWPFLADHQDPASLEARVAFHLHRLELVGRSLLMAGYDRNRAADVAAARGALAQEEVVKLAEGLGIAVQQLTRKLSLEEQRAWSFYRLAAFEAEYVWTAARRLWQSNGLSDVEAARVMGYSKSAIAKAKTQPHRFTLTFEQAARLTTALNTMEGPEALLPLPNRDTARPSRS